MNYVLGRWLGRGGVELVLAFGVRQFSLRPSLYNHLDPNVPMKTCFFFFFPFVHFHKDTWKTMKHRKQFMIVFLGMPEKHST